MQAQGRGTVMIGAVFWSWPDQRSEGVIWVQLTGPGTGRLQLTNPHFLQIHC